MIHLPGSITCYNLSINMFITSSPEGVARYCVHPVCVSGQYFGILFLGYSQRYRSEMNTGYL